MLQRLPAGLLPLLAVIVLVAAFLCGLPGADGPFVEVVGHVLPADRVNAGVPIVGSGPFADVRLTESDVADHVARLVPGDREATWVHDTTASSAAFYNPDGGLIAGVTSPPDPLVGVDDGMRVVWSDADLDESALSKACSGESGDWGTAELDLIDATGAWLLDGHGVARTIEVPEVQGAHRAIGDGELRWDGAHLWLLPRPGADPQAEGILIAGSIGRWSAGRNGVSPEALDRELDANSAKAMGLGDALPGLVEPEIGLGGNRFQKPDVYVSVDGAAPQPIGVTGDSDPTTPAFSVFRRSALAESSVPGVWMAVGAKEAVLGADPSDRPRIGRTGGFAGHVWKCADDGAERIGEQRLGTGDVVLVGRTSFEVGFRPGHVIDLYVTEPPTHRVHALSSLSVGRLRSSGQHMKVPACADERSLQIRGETSPELVPDGVEPVQSPPAPAPGQDTATIPLPAWAARVHPDIQKNGHTTVDLVEMCSDVGGLRILDDDSPPGVPLTELSGTHVADGGTVIIAGHILRYSASRPLLEQTLPMLGFVPIVLLLCLLAARDVLVAQKGFVAAPVERHGAMWAIGGFAFLLIAGALLQTHMASSERLLGSADYLQRHLLTSALAAIGFRIAVGLSVSPENWLVRLRGALFQGALGLALIAVWIFADRLIWNLVGPDWDSATASVFGDITKAEIAVVVAAALLAGAGSVLLVHAVINAIGAAVERISARIAPAHPGEALPDLPAPGRIARIIGWLDALGLFPSRRVRPLFYGAAILIVGVLIGGSGRSFGGFDLKLAEFAPWPIGLGLSGLLVGWSRTGSSFGRWTVPIATLGWLAGITGTVVVCYALRGDFGPLMVLVPAMLVTVGAWVLPWNPDPKTRLAAGSLERVPVLGGYVLIIGVGVLSVLEMVPLVEQRLTQIPGIGTHVQRAIDRFATHSSVWYTQGGHWSTTANWIAAGYYETGEHYVSNLHSDLAFVAVMQSFSWERSLVVLAAFLMLVAVTAGLGESALARAEHAWSRSRAATARDPDDRELRRRILKEGVPAWLDAGTTGYFLVFTAAYVAFEVLVHVGTCFNTLWQTGITLPWVSSGGSASVGFAMLLGAAIARGAAVGPQIQAVDPEAPRPSESKA